MAEYTPTPLSTAELQAWDSFMQHEQTTRLKVIAKTLGVKATFVALRNQGVGRGLERAKQAFAAYVISQGEKTQRSLVDDMVLRPELDRLYDEANSILAKAALDEEVIRYAELQFLPESNE